MDTSKCSMAMETHIALITILLVIPKYNQSLCRFDVLILPIYSICVYRFLFVAKDYPVGSSN